MHFLLRVVVLSMMLIVCAAVHAQQKTSEEVSKELTDYQVYAKALRETAEKLKKENEELRKRVEGKEETLWTKYYEAKASEYQFQEQMLGVNISAFYHQKIASYVILALVVLVVGGGLFFAHVQLMAGLQPIAAAAAAVPVAHVGAPPANAPLEAAGAVALPANPPAQQTAAVPLGANTFSAEMGKVTITSSVVGVVVLVISLAFLFIYTREVYRIQLIDPYRPAIADPSKSGDTGRTKPPPTTK